jgi:hypothetical protein
MHIHLFDDPTRLDLSFKSIPQSIKFIGRFGDEQGDFGRSGGSFVRGIFSDITPFFNPDLLERSVMITNFPRLATRPLGSVLVESTWASALRAPQLPPICNDNIAIRKHCNT